MVERGRKIHEEKKNERRLEGERGRKRSRGGGGGGGGGGGKTPPPPPPPPSVFPVYNLTRSPTYRRALLFERLEQATL